MSCSLGANWPEMLKSCVTNSKSRNEEVGFKFSPLNAGPPFLQVFSDDLPTFWDIQFKFRQDEARIFQMWLHQNKVRTKSPWFDFPIKIEEGLTTQNVRFTRYPQATGQDGDVYTYSAQIMAREVVCKDTGECQDGSLYILLNKNCNSSFDKAAKCFDDAINLAWPAA